MLIPNHPDDERLSALASRETDATADATLTAHVDSCIRCTELIGELGVLRAALADLPDVTPSRPLRLLPAIEAAPASAPDRLGGWARRFFAPVLASGAALALVGTIGTAAPSLSGPSADSGGAADESITLEEPAAEAAPSGAAAGAPEVAASTADLLDASERAAAGSDQGGDTAAGDGSDDLTTLEFGDGSSSADRLAVERLAAERSPWPMVLFSGVALMIAALLLRWILAPRAG